MKMKNNMKIKHWQTLWVVFALLALCFVGCKDDKNNEEVGGYDPSKPITIERFTPEEGGVNTRLVVYGDNFGNDISKMEVTIGGKKAKVIGVKGQSMYCIVPSGAYSGEIEVKVLDDNGEVLGHTAAEKIFEYKRKLLVSTFLGKYAEKETDIVKKDGPFTDCGSFQTMRWMSFDPQNPNRLYIASETKGTRVIDFEKQYVSTMTTNIDNVSCIDWTLGGDMLMTRDHASDTGIGIFLFSRASNFSSRSDVAIGRGLKSIDVHPTDGQVYLTRFRAGDVQRYDFANNSLATAFQNPYAGVAFLMIIHPTGDYAYLVETDRNYIMRSDYNKATKSFMIPYLVCGSAGADNAYADGVGSAARLARPRQGVFVKNPEYVEQGREDQYDFYFCDRENHAVRKLTPMGRVETFAGRGNNSTSGYADGDLRTEARFKNPEGITYDEQRQCFFIGDSGNFLIRKIAYEE